MKNLPLALLLLCFSQSLAVAQRRGGAAPPTRQPTGAATPTTQPTAESEAESGAACIFSMSESDGWTLRTLSEYESRKGECPGCENTESDEVFRDRAILVATLEHPPRARVTLHAFNDNGDHQEILWDPAAPEGAEQAVFLGAGKWRLTVAAEEQQLQTDNVAAAIATSFYIKYPDAAASGVPVVKKAEILFSSEQRSTSVTLAGVVARAKLNSSSFDPSVRVRCRAGTIAMDKLVLDPRRAAAASTARGLLDQSVPAPVKEVLSLLAEIAVARAKAGAMDILRDRFVTPVCDGLTLRRFRLDDGDDDDSERAFPRTCAALENMRFQDVLSSGKELLAAARDDLRLTLAPKLVETTPGLGIQTRELISVAMTFANRVVDGESSQVAEVDLLVALLDRLTVADALSATVLSVSKLLAIARFSDSEMATLKMNSVEGALPISFDDDSVPRPWHVIDACKRRNLSGGRFYGADRDACVTALLKTLDGADWISVGHGTFKNFYDIVAPEIGRAILARPLGAQTLGDEILKDRSLLADPAAQCARRVVIAVAKWCSRRDRCAAGDISAVFDRPWEFFAKPAADSPYAVCIENAGGRWFQTLPANKERYIQLATTLVSFLAPVPPGQESARTVAMIRWMFEFVRAQSGDDPTLTELEELVGRLVDGDYVRALTQVAVMLESRCTGDKIVTAQSCSKRLKKAMQLLGAVASYARTYEATQGLDAAEARKQRKEALEALIDSATDRGERGGDVVFSLGSNVGVGVAWPLTRRDSDSFDYTPTAGVRIPLGFSLQRLPGGKDDKVGGAPRWLGWHAGLTLADLGQFLAADENGTVDDVRWSNFVSPGLEAGLLIGKPSQLITITVSAAYAPALFEEPGADGSTEAQGAFRFGATLGYYVPFFDLN